MLQHERDARHAWAPVDWRTILLRVGPNYKRRKRKAPTPAPLLPCIGVDILRADHKVFSDGQVDAACLPPEVAAAAAEAPLDPNALPRFLAVTVSMPQYSGPAADGPNFRFFVLHAVPKSLRNESDGAARMLCEFLDGAASGHSDPNGAYTVGHTFHCILKNAMLA